MIERELGTLWPTKFERPSLQNRKKSPLIHKRDDIESRHQNLVRTTLRLYLDRNRKINSYSPSRPAKETPWSTQKHLMMNFSAAQQASYSLQILSGST